MGQSLREDRNDILCDIVFSSSLTCSGKSGGAQKTKICQSPLPFFILFFLSVHQSSVNSLVLLLSNEKHECKFA